MNTIADNNYYVNNFYGTLEGALLKKRRFFQRLLIVYYQPLSIAFLYALGTLMVKFVG